MFNSAFDSFVPGRLFIDFEFNSTGPTVLGLSQNKKAASWYWDINCKRTLARLDSPETRWTGHNIISADKPLIEQTTGKEIPLDRIDDTMLIHYLANADLCKQAAKDETAEERGPGYMDLWSMCSLYTDLNQWKQCRGTLCSGPCPAHDFLGYNRMDCLAIDYAWSGLYLDCFGKKKVSPSIYEKIKKLVVICDKMEKQGVKINVEYIRKFEEEIQNKKTLLFPSREEHPIGKKGQPLKRLVTMWDSPFNPNSPDAIQKYFSSRGVNLTGTDQASLEFAYRHNRKSDQEAREWLEKLIEYKASGKGTKAWFAAEYIDSDDLAHPRFIPYATSMGRLASSDPNFQNIPRIGWGAEIRRAIIARDPSLQLAKADYSQLELRAMLWYAGVKMQVKDAFTYVTEKLGDTVKRAAELPFCAFDDPRDITKSAGHALNYGEGVELFGAEEMDSPKTRKLIEAGALLIYKDWEYCGKYVGFTGVNLAQRLFGSATWENRKLALSIQDEFLKVFSEIRDLQKKISLKAESGEIHSASGRYLKLSGTPRDMFKQALAVHGQGLGADLIEEKMVRYSEEGLIPLLSVHDELDFELPVRYNDKDVKEFFSIMEEESKEFPGFSCPIKIKRGPNWRDMAEIRVG